MVNPNYKPNMGIFKLNRKIPIIPAPGVPNINWKQLTKFCRMKINSFEQYGTRHDTIEGPYFFKDNGSSILAVAHLDYVLGPLHTSLLKLADDQLFFCPTLDDRAGVYTILDYLPSKGLKYDILLTTNEEKGYSTAAYFRPPPGKRYQFVFSFDRRGTDVVMYNYFNSSSEKLLAEAGWKTSFGTYSDISDLEHLRCKGFNFGVGYYDEHSTRCHLSKNHFILNIRKFLMFYNRHVNEWMPHTPMYNVYTRDEGFGYLYTNKGQSQNSFTDEDIEILDILEKQNYSLGSKSVTPSTIKDLIKDYQNSLKSTEILPGAAATKGPQMELDFKQMNKTINIGKAPLNGSEDNPSYNQSRKIEEAKKQVAIVQTSSITATVVHGDSKELMIAAQAAADQHMVPLGVDECSQCHQPTSFILGTKNALCPKCKEANETPKEKKKGFRISTKLILFKPGVNDATCEYIEDKDGGKGWIWANAYPERVAA